MALLLDGVEEMIVGVSPGEIGFNIACSGMKPVHFEHPFFYGAFGGSALPTLYALAHLYPRGKFCCFCDEPSLFRAQLASLGLNYPGNLYLYPIDRLKSDLDGTCDYLLIPRHFFSRLGCQRDFFFNTVPRLLTKGGVLALEAPVLPGAAQEYILLGLLGELKRSFADGHAFGELLAVFTQLPTRFLWQYPALRTKIDGLSYHYASGGGAESTAMLGVAAPPYFFALFDLLHTAGLEFVGHLDLQFNDPEICLFPSQVPTWLRLRADVRIRETLLDFILNRDMRRDLWRKSGEVVALSPDAALQYLSESFFLLPRQEKSRMRRVLLLPGGHRFSLEAELYDPFFGSEEPFKLIQHPLSKSNPKAVLRALVRVVSTGQFFLGCDETPLVDLKTCPGEIPEKIEVMDENRYLLAHASDGLKGTCLVSPVTKGPAVLLSPLECLLLWKAVENGKSGAVEAAIAVLREDRFKEAYLEFQGRNRKARSIPDDEVQKTAEKLFCGRKAFNMVRLRIIL